MLLRIPLEPKEYCERWVDFPKEERGYYTACVSALAKVTGLSRRTVEKWGPEFKGCPDQTKLMLRYRDILNQIKRSLSDLDNLEE